MADSSIKKRFLAFIVYGLFGAFCGFVASWAFSESDTAVFVLIGAATVIFGILGMFLPSKIAERILSFLSNLLTG